MGIAFAATGWAGWLGWQWRRTRTIGDDIKALKAQLPKPAAGETDAPAAPAALTQQISALEKVCERHCGCRCARTLPALASLQPISVQAHCSPPHVTVLGVAGSFYFVLRFRDS